MDTNLFNYHLPTRLIAQQPAKPRDASRLMVLNRNNDKIQHARFFELPKFLDKGDVLVFNNTKVFKARLSAAKPTGGIVEVFLLKKSHNTNWEALIKGKVKLGMSLTFFHPKTKKEVLRATIQAQNENIWILEFSGRAANLEKIIDKIGAVPLPPYIKKQSALKAYQTVYAQKRGSVAAPTAGLHFTKQLLSKLRKKGVQIEYITLHVGLGTFQPIKSKRIDDHHIHSELASISNATAARLNKAKKEGRRIIAVGTTTVRTLEAFASCESLPLPGGDGAEPQRGLEERDYKKNGFKKNLLTNFHPSNPLLSSRTSSPWQGEERSNSVETRLIASLQSGTHEINLYITPGYQFKFVDAMITNFHLPKSSLLVLVASFAGRENILRAYQKAIALSYRFYSFGDGMMIR